MRLQNFEFSKKKSDMEYFKKSWIPISKYWRTRNTTRYSNQHQMCPKRCWTSCTCQNIPMTYETFHPTTYSDFQEFCSKYSNICSKYKRYLDDFFQRESDTTSFEKNVEKDETYTDPMTMVKIKHVRKKYSHFLRVHRYIII